MVDWMARSDLLFYISHVTAMNWIWFAPSMSQAMSLSLHSVPHPAEERSLHQLWWAPAVQPGSTHHNVSLFDLLSWLLLLIPFLSSHILLTVLHGGVFSHVWYFGQIFLNYLLNRPYPFQRGMTGTLWKTKTAMLIYLMALFFNRSWS